MSHDWIKKYQQELEEQHRKEKEIKNLVDRKIELLRNKIGSRLKPVVDRLVEIEGDRWEFMDWGGHSRWIWSKICRYRGFRETTGISRQIELATTIDDDWIELNFGCYVYSEGSYSFLKVGSYRFPFSYEITDDDIRQWFEYLLERSKLTWETGQKFWVDR